LTLSGDKAHKIELEIDRDIWLNGNEKELHSAFSNIVFNAVKYTPPGGEIRIRWQATEGGARLEVSDSGIGIPAQHIPRLTERFYRVDTGRSRAQGGTGLGLAIVKHVLLRHQARLDVTSEPGKGSTFSCLFPEQVLIHRKEPAALAS
jgi:two-component system phosphate regulon sensor histidine kinase PhoR